MIIALRDVEPDDLDYFFNHQLDTVANHMAAFSARDPSDRIRFDRHRERILQEDSVTVQTILANDQVAGNVLSFADFGDLEVSYWIDSAMWGRGIATEAVRLFLNQMAVRPVYARAAADNAGSIRVLEENGLVPQSTAFGFADYRNEEIEEVILIKE